MKKPQKARKKRDKSQLIAKLVFILAVSYVLFTFYDQYKEMKYLKTYQESLVEDINQVEKEIQILKNQVENSNTDQHIEKIARSNLKMVKKNELIFVDMGNGGE